MLFLSDRILWKLLMMTHRHKYILYPFGLIVVLLWLGGCGGLPQYIPAEPPVLTVDQRARVGAAVQPKLLQLLGGPYHDQRLAEDLNQLGNLQTQDSRPLKIVVADRNATALYALPGGRIIMTRGLLVGLHSRAELEAVVNLAGQLAERIYRGSTSRSMVEATEQVLATKESWYDPDAASIQLARYFEEHACAEECLTPVRAGRSATGTASTVDLPDSVNQLREQLPGYELLARAREFEKAEEQGKAIATYLQAAATAPDEPQILGALGLAYLRAGQTQPARLHLQKAVKLQPDYYRTLMGLGYLSLQQGQFQQANELLADSVRRLAVAENLFLLAEAREKSGDIEGALALYRLVAKTDRYGKLGQTSAERLVQPAGAQ
jgi:tetratricopeptide (TPR) repeat protein